MGRRDGRGGYGRGILEGEEGGLVSMSFWVGMRRVWEGDRRLDVWAEAYWVGSVCR